MCPHKSCSWKSNSESVGLRITGDSVGKIYFHLEQKAPTKGKIGRYHCMMEGAQESPNLVLGLGRNCDEGRVASGED